MKKTMRKKVISVMRNGGKEAFIRQMVPNLFSNAFQQNLTPAQFEPIKVKARFLRRF